MNRTEYLRIFYERLHFLPEEERVDAVREIESNMAESLTNGVPEAVILSRLGDPRKLAKAYQSEYMIGKGPRRSLRWLGQMIAFYCTSGLLSLMVVPLLATLAYGFGFCAVLALVGGALRSFGIPWINMSLGDGIEVPYAWSMPFGVLLALITGGIAWVSHKYLLIYMKFVSRQYSRMIPR
jgi:uncharacterized membrane protein